MAGAPRYCFSDGFEAKYVYKKRGERAGDSAGELTPFDNETLGGNIGYYSLIESTCRLAGEPDGLTRLHRWVQCPRYSIRGDDKALPARGEMRGGGLFSQDARMASLAMASRKPHWAVT